LRGCEADHGHLALKGFRAAAGMRGSPMLAALASAQAARDPSTAAHCARVTYLAGRLAARMGWDEARLRQLAVGPRLQDLGQVVISERILRKRGPLSP